MINPFKFIVSYQSKYPKATDCLANCLAITEADERSTTSTTSFAQYLLGVRTEEIRLGS
jgi:hypothetical protein